MTEANQEPIGLLEAAVAHQPVSFAIAPWWHTAWVLLTLMTWAVLALRGSSVSESQPHWRGYLSMVLMQWVVLGAVISGIFQRQDFFFHTLLRSGRSWWIELGRGIGIYVMAILLIIVGAVVAHAMGYHEHSNSNVFLALVPNNWREVVLLGVVTVSIGFCEEHIMRGYLLQQLIGWGCGMRMTLPIATVFAVITSSVFFGCLHVYEGRFGAISIGFLGVLYALAALRFGNLRAAIVAHALQDFTALMLSMSGSHSLR